MHKQSDSLKELKIRWRLYDTEDEPTTRQRGLFFIRYLKSIGYDVEVWDKREKADIIILQYSMEDLSVAKQMSPVIIADINDMVFAGHHCQHNSTMNGLKIVDAVVAGSTRIAEHLQRHHHIVRMIDEPIDTDYLSVKKKRHDGFNILWTGMHDNITYFNDIDCVLTKLHEDNFKFNVDFVCPKHNGHGKLNSDVVKEKLYPSTHYEWSKEVLMERMSFADIGIAPLFQNEWCWCKSPNKALTLMAAGLPVVVSNVPSYKRVVTPGHDGFLSYDADEWYNNLATLMINPIYMKTMETNARSKAKEFTVDKIAGEWLNLFREVRKT